LATILTTDIVDSTTRAASMGDRRWHDLLDQHYAQLRERVRAFQGREVKTTGDGILATFDGPGRAIRCAVAVRDASRDLGLEIRAGLHTGEVEVMGDDIGGIAVHIGQRVSSLARPGEVLVSRTLVDLMAGSQIQFTDRGEHDLKGVPRVWRLFTVQT
jgi:class 3 adenylate cyclase